MFLQVRRDSEKAAVVKTASSAFPKISLMTTSHEERQFEHLASEVKVQKLKTTQYLSPFSSQAKFALPFLSRIYTVASDRPSPFLESFANSYFWAKDLAFKRRSEPGTTDTCGK